MGDVLPEMPLFLEPDGCVPLPLEATYQTAFELFPARWRMVLEPTALAEANAHEFAAIGRPRLFRGNWRPGLQEGLPAIQNLIQHGHLDVPVIGVAKAGWGLEQFRRALATASRSTAASTRPLSRSFSPVRLRGRRLQDSETFNNYARPWAGATTPSLPGDTAQSLRCRRGTSRQFRVCRRRTGRDREAVWSR